MGEDKDSTTLNSSNSKRKRNKGSSIRAMNEAELRLNKQILKEISMKKKERH